MRQLGDVLVWAAMITAVIGVLYMTPRVTRYFTDDPGAVSLGISRDGVVLAGYEPDADLEPNSDAAE